MVFELIRSDNMLRSQSIWGFIWSVGTGQRFSTYMTHWTRRISSIVVKRSHASLLDYTRKIEITSMMSFSIRPWSSKEVVQK